MKRRVFPAWLVGPQQFSARFPHKGTPLLRVLAAHGTARDVQENAEMALMAAEEWPRSVAQKCRTGCSVRRSETHQASTAPWYGTECTVAHCVLE